jgi:hypothetical protein
VFIVRIDRLEVVPFLEIQITNSRFAKHLWSEVEMKNRTEVTEVTQETEDTAEEIEVAEAAEVVDDTEEVA